MKLENAVDEFIMDKRLKNLSEATITNYRKVLNELSDEHGGTELIEFNPEIARCFLNHLQTRENKNDGSIGLSRASLELYYRVIHNFGKWCAIQNYIKSPPTEKIPKPKTDNKLPEAISDENLEILFEILESKASFRIQVIFEFFLDTGCRVSEVVGLNVKDVHLDNGWAMIRGKGNREDIIPLGQSLTIDLHKYLYDIRPKLDSQGKKAAFFLTNRGDRYSRSGLSMLVRRYLTEAGVDGKVGPHKLRHTFATNYLRFHGDLESLRRIMRHSSVQTTQRYIALLPEDLIRAHQKASPLDNFRRRKN